MCIREARQAGVRGPDVGGRANALAKSTVGSLPAAPGQPTASSGPPLPPPPPPHPPTAWGPPSQQRVVRLATEEEALQPDPSDRQLDESLAVQAAAE
eukprot:6172994-Pyramimonas_sp.AAC.1